MILGLRKQREARGATRGEAVRDRRRRAEGEEAGRLQAEASEAASIAAAAEKELRPWPKKTGPYDHTPKRPSEGDPINYWKVCGRACMGTGSYFRIG
jgi:CRISPR-associated protein Cas5t